MVVLIRASQITRHDGTHGRRQGTKKHTKHTKAFEKKIWPNTSDSRSKRLTYPNGETMEDAARKEVPANNANDRE